VLLNRARVLLGLRRYQEALEWCAKVLEIAPLDPEVWAVKGDVFMGCGFHEQADSCFEKALELNPQCRSAMKSREENLQRLRSKEGDLA
jgi:tetratricopeptide (TPR) repeat protein